MAVSYKIGNEITVSSYILLVLQPRLTITVENILHR